MKEFVCKIGFAFMVLVVVLSTNYGLNRYFISIQDIVIDNSILLMGGSHIKSGLNPKYIENSQNIASAGETYFDTFYKLKYLVDNPKNNIRSVLLGFGYNNISGINDDKYSTEAMSIEYLERSYPIVSLDILRSIGVNKTGYLKAIIRKMCLYPSFLHNGFIGEGFKGREAKLDFSDALKRVKLHYYAGDTIRNASERDIRYLDSIVNLIDLNELNLVMVNIPQRKEYYSGVPDRIKARYNKIRNGLIEKDIRFIDLMQMELDSSNFANHDHMSASGAKVISDMVADSLILWSF